MDIVIDANVLFASLLKEGLTAELIMSDNFHLFAPEFLLEEFSKYEQTILDRTKRTTQEFNEILEILKEVIAIIPMEEFEDKLIEAKEISPDPDDVHYLALALKLCCPIWSNDKKLKEQSIIKVYTTEELSKIR